jgi:hypothetical protein
MKVSWGLAFGCPKTVISGPNAIHGINKRVCVSYTWVGTDLATEPSLAQAEPQNIRK